jgi:hypothetical protein
LGVCQLSASADDLRRRIQRFINEGSGAADLEGRLFVASENSLKDLLIVGSSTAEGLFSSQPETVLAENLHWTARYRVFRLLRALRGGPLVPQE